MNETIDARIFSASAAIVAGGVADNSWEFQGLKSAVHIEGTINNPSDVDTLWSLEIE